MIGGGGGGVDEERSPAASLPHHENHTAVRLTAHPALQHARWQVKLLLCIAGVEILRGCRHSNNKYCRGAGTERVELGTVQFREL